MNRSVAYGFALSLLPLAALAQTPAPATGGTSVPSAMVPSSSASTTTPMTGAAASGGGAVGMNQLSAADKQFINQAAIAGMSEVREGRVAEQKGDATAKAFGRKMVSDHMQANAKLIALAKEKGLTPPTRLDAEHREKLAMLRKAPSSQFSSTYLQGEIKDHQQVIDLFQQEASQGSDPQVKALAQGTLPMLQQHLQLAQQDAAKS